MLVRSPLLVQSSWPRFAAPGDRFTVPLVVFNNTPADGVGEGPVRLLERRRQHAGPLDFATTRRRRDSPSPPIAREGRRAGDVRSTSPPRNAIGVGRARLVAEMNGETYEESLELPVRPASPAVTDGGYVAANARRTLTHAARHGMLDGTGDLQVRVAPWPRLELPRGLDYLDRYPYGCAEQTTSTLLPARLPPRHRQADRPRRLRRDRVNEKLAAGITRLIGMQTAGGGLAMWPGGRDALAVGQRLRRPLPRRGRRPPATTSPKISATPSRLRPRPAQREPRRRRRARTAGLRLLRAGPRRQARARR